MAPAGCRTSCFTAALASSTPWCSSTSSWVRTGSRCSTSSRWLPVAPPKRRLDPPTPLALTAVVSGPDQRGRPGVGGAPEQEVPGPEPEPADVRVVPGAVCRCCPRPRRHLLLPDAGGSEHSDPIRMFPQHDAASPVLNSGAFKIEQSYIVPYGETRNVRKKGK